MDIKKQLQSGYDWDVMIHIYIYMWYVYIYTYILWDRIYIYIHWEISWFKNKHPAIMIFDRI